MTFQCLRRACLIYFPANLRLYLVLKTRRIAVDLSFLWWNVGGLQNWSRSPPWKVQRHCTLWLKVSPWRNLSFWQMCQDCCCCFYLFVCLFVHRRWSHLEGNSRRWVADGIKTCMCKNCPVSVFFVWHLMSRILFHQIVSLCKYSLYKGAKYIRSYSLQPETRSWRSFHIYILFGQIRTEKHTWQV